MEKKLESELDSLYYTAPQTYLKRLNEIKEAGYRVYRNSHGKHLVKPIDIYSAFGGVFGDIFKGGK